MTIKKAKLKDDTLEITYTKREEDGSVTTVNEAHSAKVHPDLVASFQNLRVHLGLLFGVIPVKSVKKIETPAPELVENFTVSGISVKTGDDPGVVITGHMITPWQKAAIMNTPFTRLEEADESAYKFKDDLQQKIDRAVAEVQEYLNGKKADDPQQQLPFETGSGSTNGTEDAEFEEVGGDPEIWNKGERPKL